MLKVMMTYPGLEDEVTVLDRFTGGYTVRPEKVISADKIIEIRGFVKEIYAESEIKKILCIAGRRHPQSREVRDRCRELHLVRCITEGFDLSRPRGEGTCTSYGKGLCNAAGC
ncbi:hypothetical protein [Methanolacinia petrolearia]|uniref:hypothetical protein n=1 Tax=Methanolacinia petrolearia TaxID=54120 RepID=UPI003BAC6BAE